MKGIFKKKPNESAPTPAPQNTHENDSKLLYMRNSITSLFKNKNNKSKLAIKDIDLIEGMEANDLMKLYTVSEPKVPLLEMMVADYKRGRFSIPGASTKQKKKKIALDQAKLDQMINEYDEEVRKKDLEEIQNNAETLKKKFALSNAQVLKLDNIVQELHQGKSYQLDIATVLLDPKDLTKEQFHSLIKEYEDTQVKKSRLSQILDQSRQSLEHSKKKVFHLMGKRTAK
ncbi:hypothetical protein HW555_000187 [Spodoptera exigua]|nr:hypothetical protein HW555_000187 [Spodoptera exigua]